MKKRILIALVLFSLAASAYSQTPDISLFARPNTVWSVASYVTEVHPDDISFVFYYKLCEASSESNVYPMKGGGSYQGYSLENIDECPVLFNVRITNDSLLYFEYPNENPALVFDYKACVGDTITLDGYAEDVYSVYKIVVCNIDTIENEGHQYKMWTLVPVYSESRYDGGVVYYEGCSSNWFSSVWFSEVGSGLGFYEYTMYNLPDWTGGFNDVLCVWYNDSIIFHNASQYRPDYDLSAFPRNYCTMEDVEALTENKIFTTENISISPNPVNDILRIEIPKENTCMYDVSILDNTGVEMKNFSSAGSFEFDVSELPSGVYFVKVFADDKFFIGKFFKN